MHRGELTIDEATDFLVEHTSFERPNARAEVQWYTYRPTYPLSYLLGRTPLLALRRDEERRLGQAFRLKDFHDALLRNGSIPVSFHRRLLAGRLSARAGHPSIDLEGGRSRVVYWPGASTGSGAPTDRPERSRSGSSGRARDSSTSWTFEGARVGRSGEPRGARRRSVPGRACPSSSRVASHSRQHPLAFAAGATRVVLTTAIADRPDDLRACLAVAGDWLAVGPRPPAGTAVRIPMADGRLRPRRFAGG